MCFIKDKWRKFEPNQKYLSIVSGLTSVTKLHNYLLRFHWQGEKWYKDHWKTPLEFIENKDRDNDCEDFARFACDVLVRVIGMDEARFIAHIGYNKKRWGNRIWNLKGHAICVFPYQGKLAVFSNNRLYFGLDSFEEAGYITYPDGLKYQQVRNGKGKILSKKIKIFGVF